LFSKSLHLVQRKFPYMNSNIVVFQESTFGAAQWHQE
jgi:hypothetical protein